MNTCLSNSIGLNDISEIMVCIEFAWVKGKERKKYIERNLMLESF